MSGMDTLGVLVDTARDVGAHAIDRARVALHDLVTGDDSERLAAGERALARYRDLAGSVTGPSGAPGGVVPEAFEAMSHPAIWGHAAELTPAMLDAGAETWRMAHERLAAAVTTLWRDLEAVLGSDWEGMAADAALAAVAAYRDRSLNSVDLMGVVSAELDVARHGLAATRESVPPPQSFTPSDFARVAVTTLSLNPMASAHSVTALFAEEEERRAEAVAVMKSVYVPTVLRADSSVPALPPPVDPAPGSTVEGGGGSGGTGGPSAETAFGAGSAVTPVGTAPAFADTVAASAAAPEAPGGAAAGDRAAAVSPAGAGSGAPPAGSAAGTAPGGVTSAGSSAWGPASSAPASAGSARAGTSGSGTSRGAARSGSGGAGRGGSGGAPGHARGPADGAGTRILGERAVAPAGSLGSAASGTGGGAVARGGMMGPAAMMPGRGGGDDSEHRPAARYLVTADNGDALVGDLPLVAPPVIG
ncbi:hypothetical protein [Rhodococcoides corynebacterioides]|uniref:PPE domain-containing protein n=1 Tax=Rhodococcoides corynebacterioides TaxID=53972 RepID=A0ABS7P2H4_9NOCA|nr:hypothetical protein [Rhodococcus corynebacterioides]MBY6366619.1 hypothetical protein [Rhodococcus corynebacterioides]MBY6408682.1 hypothetical protein [Rhodococcus corynebacterioides]